jgi:hypothetical protein
LNSLMMIARSIVSFLLFLSMTCGTGIDGILYMRPNARQKTEEYLLFLEKLDEIPGQLAAYHARRAQLDKDIDIDLLATRAARPEKFEPTLKYWQARQRRRNIAKISQDEL